MTRRRAEPVTPAPLPFSIDQAHQHEVVGLYLAPPERALALCVELEAPRRATGNPEAAEGAAQDSVPAESCGLFEALDLTTDRTVGSLHRRRRAVEFRRFLSRLDEEIPTGLEIHLICDSQASYRAPTVKNWLLAHPRFRLHFTTDASAWVALAARRFAEPALGREWHGAAQFVPAPVPLPEAELDEAVRGWVGAWDETSAPYTWTRPVGRGGRSGGR
ncbi:hypothetical protein [Streptomyces sp. H27-D2]|uniref:hypothetical protein n=1 Tax=Streptomyces sp. H27-D2 TaxID=3046304 RepID=UPI002DB80EBD|nr:hypothetical protein [Streptomyces sp. H27-D2]MEC4020184.1 hypothetical protein [Streptomyces sp. H27-D2]